MQILLSSLLVVALADACMGQTMVRGREPLNIIVGVADNSLTQSQTGESNLGNMVTDAMVWAHRNNILDGDKPNLAMINSGNLRVGLPKGNITLEDLFNLIPPEDTFDLVSIKGRHLRLSLEHSMSVSPSGRFLQVSGFQIQFNFLRDEGSRVWKVKVKAGNDTYVDLEDEKVYHVVMNKYIAEGGDGYSVIAENKIMQEQGPSGTDLLMVFIMRNTPISAFLEGRILTVRASYLELDYDTVARLAALPVECIKKEFPYKLGQVLGSKEDLKSPSELHPIFYGCFDWHSSVHGYWTLSRALRLHLFTPLATNISLLLDTQFTPAGVAAEMDYFAGKNEESFERTYGWAWLLKLHQNLVSFKEEDVGQYWEGILEPLATMIRTRMMEFLPKLVYPVRVGMHINTAFALSLTLDYARTPGVEDTELEEAVLEAANKFYLNDTNCPLSWEPSGFDFLSPCLQEADLMSKVISDQADFTRWLGDFLPQLFEGDIPLEEGQVSDRTDGLLVHIDGLNFSRAWALYRTGQRLDGQVGRRLLELGDRHMAASLLEVAGSHYMGSHWLATFLLYALQAREEALQENYS